MNQDAMLTREKELMNARAPTVAMVLIVITGGMAPMAEPPVRKSPKEALKAFNQLIGSWRGTGSPEGTREEKQRGFWVESMTWEWQFKGNDVWLQVAVDKGKYLLHGELRYLPDKDLFQFNVTTPGKETVAFTGPFKDHALTLEHVDEQKMETQRLVITLLHNNRFLYRYEFKNKDRPLFTRLYQVGVTKEGEPFAGPANSQPECIVSGGLGTIKVEYKGQTYYVCCSGCRSAFKDNPVFFIKDYEAKKAKEKAK
jgi:hypothetical protein